MCLKLSISIVLILTATAFACTKVQLTCDRLASSYWDEPEGSQVGIGHLLTCTVRSIQVSVTSSNSAVESIMHKNGTLIKNPEQIGALVFENSKMSFVLKQITNFLTNLLVAQFSNNGLLAISKDDLKQFGSKLELVDFSFNNLTSVDADLFEHNRQLRTVIFRHNPLRFIYPKFFESLVSLTQLKFAYLVSGCINAVFYSKNHDDIERFDWKNAKCSNSTLRVKDVRPEHEDC